MSVLLPGLARAASDGTARRDADARVTLAIRQPMLIQTMTHAACFAMGGVNPALTRSTAIEEHDTFRTVLDAFRRGHEWLGVLPGARPEVLARVDATALRSRDYLAAILQIVHGDFHGTVMRQILDDNARITDASIALADLFIAEYADDGLSGRQLAALRLAGHFRMMTQRALTEMCLVHFGIGGARMAEILTRTLDEVESLYGVLSEGDADVAPPPNARIGRNFRTAKLFWDKMRPVLDRVAAGEDPAEADVQKVLKFNKSVLKQLNQAIEGYLAMS